MNNYDRVLRALIVYYRIILGCTWTMVVLVAVITFVLTKSYYERAYERCKMAKNNFATCCINK